MTLRAGGLVARFLSTGEGEFRHTFGMSENTQLSEAESELRTGEVTAALPSQTDAGVYFIGRAGLGTNTIFPWVVSDFGLTDAIEAGLVKIPQLAVRDTTGAEIAGCFNIWRWILPKLTSAERGGKKANPKPEAILKYANTPIAMLGGLWDELRREWAAEGDETRPPVFILVCKNTRIARVIYEWIGEDKPPTGI